MPESHMFFSPRFQGLGFGVLGFVLQPYTLNPQPDTLKSPMRLGLISPKQSGHRPRVEAYLPCSEELEEVIPDSDLMTVS